MVKTKSVVHSDPEIQGGVSVFVGTRVPVKTLFDHLEVGDSLDKFYTRFPESRENKLSLC
jgi:uncharacterized protein (DUF433 family)